MRLRLPRYGRRPALVGAAVVVAMAAGALTGVQIRAAEAADRRQDVAADVAADRVASAEAASRTAERVGLLDVALDWAAGAQDARAALEAADAALVVSQGKVADDAVRRALVAAAVATRALVDGRGGAARADVAALADAVAELAAATAAVAQAQAAWQTEQDAAAAAAAEAAAAAAAEEAAAQAHAGAAGGAAADCGSAASYQAPEAGGLHTSVPSETGDGTNGNMPRSSMTALPWCTDSLGNQQWLRADAAAALVRLNDAFRAEFGENIAIDLSYRSYDDQVLARELYGGLAARPGTSNHGWGTAIDTWEWAAYDFGSPRYEWLVANGPAFGWVCPAASESGNSEYWHYEYVG